MECCTIPMTAHYIVDENGAMLCEYERCQVEAKELADLLVRGFGIDVESFTYSEFKNGIIS